MKEYKIILRVSKDFKTKTTEEALKKGLTLSQYIRTLVIQDLKKGD